jgi:Putative transposase
MCTMKKAWRDGTHATVLQPLDLIARLWAMIPPPRLNMIRSHGVFAPNAKLRSEVAPKKEVRELAEHSAGELDTAEQTGPFGDEPLESK